MSAELVLGELDASLEQHVARIAGRIGLKGYSTSNHRVGRLARIFNPRSRSEPAENVAISAINVASLELFNSYAAQLQGSTGADALERTTYHNLPGWLQSVWLPIEFDPPNDLASDEGDPLFVGSSVRLLSELAEIQNKSTLGLGTRPNDYDVMRTDYHTWLRSSLGARGRLSETDTIRWVWHSLNDGAEISKQRRVPMRLLA